MFRPNLHSSSFQTKVWDRFESESICEKNEKIKKSLKIDFFNTQKCLCSNSFRTRSKAVRELFSAWNRNRPRSTADSKPLQKPTASLSHRQFRTLLSQALMPNHFLNLFF